MRDVEIYEMFEQNALYQYFFAFTVNLYSFCFGLAGGWASPTVILLLSDETPLPSGKITVEEASWIVSLLFVGGIIGNILFGYITNHFGRKIPLLVMTVPVIISWLLIVYAQNITYLYAARTLNGIVGGGIFIVVPLFLSEIAIDRVRGTLVSMLVLSENAGILVAFILGHYAGFYSTPWIMIGLTITFAVLFVFFPESPTVLVKRGKNREAEDSIRFYQNLSTRHSDYMVLQVEMDKIQRSFGNSTTKRFIEWSDLKTSPAGKAIVIGVVMAGFSQFTGCTALLNYTAYTFELAGSNISSNVSAICVGAISLIGSIVSSYFVDRAGRKLLFALSTFGAAIGLIILGIFVLLKSYDWNVEDFKWVPLVSFSFAIFSGSLAILNLPFVVISEIMPENIKDFGMSVSVTVMWSTSFVVIKYLPNLAEIAGFPATMFMFGFMCILSEVLIIFYVPETKEKSHDEIMDSLREM